MGNANYRQIPHLIEQRAEFEGNSMRGQQTGPCGHHRGRGYMNIPDNADYIVISYSTPIGYAIGADLFVTSERFSQTTSRQQGILRSLGAKEVTP